MKGKYIGTIAFLVVIVLLLASCSLIPPDMVLRVINQSIDTSIGGGNVRITFQLYNSGSERLQNCKVRWFVDDTFDAGSDGVIDYDEITVWAPGTGVDLAAYATSAEINVYTTSVDFSGGVNFYGIYEMGWNYSSDE